jgi:hypothetical protein
MDTIWSAYKVFNFASCVRFEGREDTSGVTKLEIQVLVIVVQAESANTRRVCLIANSKHVHTGCACLSFALQFPSFRAGGCVVCAKVSCTRIAHRSSGERDKPLLPLSDID